KFQNVEYEIGETGAPIIKGCIGYLECEVKSSIDVGDHTVYVGRVIRAGSGSDERPLIYNPKDYF
ncbi:MAG: flavin reductase family protein, partial [Candidatus Bathyarchaeia archaeon]